MKTSLKYTVILLAVALVVGCSGNNEQVGEQQTVQQNQGRSASAMQSELKAKLLADSQLSGWGINTDVHNNIATISGEVPNEQIKQKATELANTVNGIETVRNDLTVTNKPMEQESRGATSKQIEMKAKLLADSQLSGWGIGVDVTNEIMTLTGTVASEADKQKATRLAKTVAGVSKINNELVVTGVETAKTPEGAADTALSQQIEQKYAMDPDMQNSRIQVRSQEGKVTLQGSVVSPEQKQKAEEIAKNTEGVKEVNSQLQIKPVAQPAALDE